MLIPNRCYLSSQCLFCTSRRCGVVIYTNDLSFLQLACDTHIKDLEEYADFMLQDRIRTHITSSQHLSRARVRNDHTAKALIFVSQLLENSADPELQKKFRQQFDAIRLPFKFTN